MATGLPMNTMSVGGLQNRAFIAPSFSVTKFNTATMLTRQFRPFRHTFRFTLNSQIYIVTAITSLLFGSRPSHVARSIMSFPIRETIQRMTRSGSTSNFGQKLRVVVKQKLDTFFAPTGIVFRGWRLTSFFSRIESSVFWCIGSCFRFTVRGFTDTCCVSVKTSTGNSIATQQSLRANDFLGATVAQTAPHWTWATFANAIASRFQDGVSPKSLTRQIFGCMISASFLHTIYCTSGVI